MSATVTRSAKRLVTLIAVCSLFALSTVANAAPGVAVDFTVSETLPVGTPGVMTLSDIPGCGSASVTTTGASASVAGPNTTFRGAKVFDCGSAGTFTLQFKATASGCSATDAGTWKITDGTGSFEGAKGHGQLVGSYVYMGGPGTFCMNTGIDDRYTGTLKLAP